MDSVVYIKPGNPGEGLPTFIAFIGFLSCMNSLMLYQSRALAEGFPTFFTCIRFLPI
ncbi:unnamed protein product [Gulo gulo]|uniref:Uncharacterized protein n=1 Tax=Gulo gulo TaxID=48420 RepID=A0A9X9M0I4_GULGU|nr:unnamed protein product [Gulo gulo]